MEPTETKAPLSIDPTITPILPTQEAKPQNAASPWTVIFGLLFLVATSSSIYFYSRSQSLEQELRKTPSPSPSTSLTPTEKPIKVKILDTKSWVESACGQAPKVLFKTPAEWKVSCTDKLDGTADVVITHEGGNMWDAQIQVRNYDGGSRRQYWISQIGDSDIDKYIRFQETQFGTVLGLDVFGSSGWWQGGYSSPILIANNKTIVLIYGGRDFDDTKNKITRWDMTDTIVSTIKFITE